MTTNEVIDNLKHKAFLSRSAVSSHQKLSAVQRLLSRPNANGQTISKIWLILEINVCQEIFP